MTANWDGRSFLQIRIYFDRARQHFPNASICPITAKTNDAKKVLLLHDMIVVSIVMHIPLLAGVDVLPVGE